MSFVVLRIVRRPTDLRISGFGPHAQNVTLF
jgi:hypothetical protein